MCFLSPKYFEWSDMMGKGSVSLKQDNWFHLAHGAKERGEMGDKGVDVRVAGWGCLTPDSKPKILTCICLSSCCYLIQHLKNTLQVFWGMDWFYVCYCNLHSAWHRGAQILINPRAPRVHVQDFLLWHGDCQMEGATWFFTVESLVPGFLIVPLSGQYKNEKRLCSLLPV